jgi:phosphate transport system protein
MMQSNNMKPDRLPGKYVHELDEILSRVLLMGGAGEAQFDKAVHAFRTGNVERAKKVIVDDRTINQLEVQLDAACSQLLVRRLPAGNDLRTVMVALKTITDLERLGDEASKIARAAVAGSVHRNGLLASSQCDAVHVIARSAGGMLHDALNAFARLDGILAREVIFRDDAVDHQFRSFIRNMVTFMMEEPRMISAALDTLWVAKAVERVGDHAKNIAEYVVYVVDGMDIRHSGGMRDAS